MPQSKYDLSLVIACYNEEPLLEESVRQTVEHLQDRGAEVMGVSVLIDRSGGEAKFDCPFVPLAQLTMTSSDPYTCELCEKQVPLVEPDDIVV